MNHSVLTVLLFMPHYPRIDLRRSHRSCWFLLLPGPLGSTHRPTSKPSRLQINVLRSMGKIIEIEGFDDLRGGGQIIF